MYLLQIAISGDRVAVGLLCRKLDQFYQGREVI